jgi:hypothetical protein
MSILFGCKKEICICIKIQSLIIMKQFQRHCKVVITYGIWGLKFNVKVKIHPHPTVKWDNNKMFNNADTHPPTPVPRLLVVWKVLRCNSDCRFISERRQIFFHCRVTVNVILTTWYFQSPGPPQMLYTLSDMTAFLTETYRSTSGIYTLAIQCNVLTLIPRHYHM